MLLSTLLICSALGDQAVDPAGRSGRVYHPHPPPPTSLMGFALVFAAKQIGRRETNSGPTLSIRQGGCTVTLTTCTAPAIHSSHLPPTSICISNHPIKAAPPRLLFSSFRPSVPPFRLSLSVSPGAKPRTGSTSTRTLQGLAGLVVAPSPTAALYVRRQSGGTRDAVSTPSAKEGAG